MLLKISNLTTILGSKELFDELSFVLNEGEKVGFIGRNGLGKTSLLRILAGEYLEYTGDIEFQKSIRIVMTRQEHFFSREVTPLDYVLDNIPRYREIKSIINDYIAQNSDISLELYCDALQEFNDLEYFSIEDRVIQSLADFELDIERILSPISSLSGGEKRFVELVRVMYSGADLALIDEPTNHMDYIGKERFIKWLNTYKKTVIVVTHDRDVLKSVSRIIELKDKKLLSFNGDYDSYIKQNSLSNVSSIAQYEIDLKNIEKAKKQMLNARSQKMEAKSDDGRTAARIREERFKREYEILLSSLKKPSLWIDQESLSEVSTKVTESYHKYKEKNIAIVQRSETGHKKLLIEAKNLSLGYEKPVFDKVNFQLYFGDKLFIKGRNGAGKSTLVKKIISLVNDFEVSSKIFAGDIKLGKDLKIGVYEQEISKEYLEKTLEEAIKDLYYALNIPFNNEKLNIILKRYLFDPQLDSRLRISQLSGGQKARFQLIKMFLNNPNILILDEPTNHLDLPSIEELEKSLQDFHGGIIYISHDSYFVNNLGGSILEIKAD
jgi:ATP-binding cassette subfamily F protein 3